MAIDELKVAHLNADDPQRLTTPEARLSYPNLFKPRKDDRGDDKWDLVLIFDKEGFDKKAFNQIVIAAGEAEYGKDFIAKVKAGKLALPKIHDGADKPDDPALGPTKLFLRAGAKRKPTVVDQDLNVIPDTDAHRVYAGCYVRAAIRAFPFTYKNASGAIVKQGISFGLQNVQLIRDGEPLGAGASDPKSDFGAVAKLARPASAAAATNDDDLLGGASTGDLADDLSL